MQTISYYNSLFGKILLSSDDFGLTGLWFKSSRYYGDILATNYQIGSNEYIIQAKEWLNIYFSKNKPTFIPELHLIGTTFQKKVWQALQEIPYGQLSTYKQIATKISSNKQKTPYRAVGNAIGHNHIALIIPCHRVIASNGKLNGYNAGSDVKRKLLSLEGGYKV